MPAKGVEGAQGCSDPVSYPDCTEMGARAGLGCCHGAMTQEDLQLICHLDGAAGDSSTRPTSAHTEVRA